MPEFSELSTASIRELMLLRTQSERLMMTLFEPKKQRKTRTIMRRERKPVPALITVSKVETRVSFLRRAWNWITVTWVIVLSKKIAKEKL